MGALERVGVRGEAAGEHCGEVFGGRDVVCVGDVRGQGESMLDWGVVVVGLTRAKCGGERQL